MKIVFFGHPAFIGSQSMNRFAKLLAEGMQARGHQVELWAPTARFARLKATISFRKWLGYIDQYIVFPIEVRRRLKSCPADTLFVFTDNALGPWVPLVTDWPHVIHCHDFLAQRSALGEIPENVTGWTGKQYQAFIRWGYRKGNCFIADSYRTQDDLLRLLEHRPRRAETIYIGLNSIFTPREPSQARSLLNKKTGLDVTDGYLLHVGSEIWYKNRTGVLEIYEALRRQGLSQLPLVMIGQNTGSDFLEHHAKSLFKADIHLLDGIDDEGVRLAYAGAEVLIFPSRAEGFGWPIAEAMASGCPVVTTNEAPMTEVAGNAAFLIPRRPDQHQQADLWAREAAGVVGKVLNLSPVDRKNRVEAGLANAKRFDPGVYLDTLEVAYKDILCQ